MGQKNYYDVATRWCDVALGRQTRLLSNDRMMPGQGGDVLYSYGSHFTLVRRLKDKKGNTTAFLLNGDSYSVTTSRHQSEVRSAVARTGLPSVIIPFSALSAADLSDDTIEILDVLPDRMVVKRHSFTEVQPSWQWRDDPVYAHRDKTFEELQAIVDKRNAEAHEELLRKRGYAIEERDENLRKVAAGGEVKGYTLWSEYLPGGKRYYRQALSIDDLSYWDTNQVRYIDHYERNLYVSGTTHARRVTIEEVGGEPIEYWYETSRHWLGESLIRAKVPYTTLHRCQDCGGHGTTPFAPEWRPTWWDAYDEEYRRERELEWYRQSSACTTCQGRRRVSRRHQRVAHFLSGFDHNETRNLYFFSELPTRKSMTVEEAYEELKPDTVKIAEQMGREIQRQGDIFAVPMPDLDKRALRQMGATFEKGDYLLGTNHRATEVARLKDGRTLARGTLTHDPGFRGPDHKRVSLPKGVWHLTVKNTVPIG